MLDLFFILLTQLINETNFTIDFQVIGEGRRLLPELRPGRTRFVKESRVLQRLGEYSPDPDWKIRVLIDGEFTGIELDPQLLIRFVRVVFRVDGVGSDLVLCVGGIQENCNDYFLRCRFIGCMRNIFWDGRAVESIDRSDSKLATKLRNLEGDHCEGLASFVDVDKKRTATPRPRPQVSNSSTSSSDSHSLTSPRHRISSERRSSPAPAFACPSPRHSPHQKPSPVAAAPLPSLAPLVRYASPGPSFHDDDRENCSNTITQISGQERDSPRPPTLSSVDSEDSTVKVDSFVHGLLFVFAFIIVFILLKLP